MRNHHFFQKLLGTALLLPALHCLGLLSAHEDWSPLSALILTQTLGGGSGSSSDSGGGTSDSAETLGPGETVTTGGGFSGIVIDEDGDGIAEGIDLLTGVGTAVPELFVVGSNGGLDANGDGNPDFYYTLENGTLVLTNQPNGQGGPVALVDDPADGIPDGYDLNGDGIADITILAQIQTDTTPPSVTPSLASGTYAGDSGTGTKTILYSCSDGESAPGSMILTGNGSDPSFNPKNGTLAKPGVQASALIGPLEISFTVKVLCRDLAGNETLETYNYTIDNSLPAVGATPDSQYLSAGGRTSTNVSITSDHSGTVEVRKNATGCSDGSIQASQSITAGVPYSWAVNATDLVAGTNTFYVRVVSSVNATEGCTSTVLTRDDVAPGVSYSPAGGNYTSAQAVSILCNDTGNSGCLKSAYTMTSTTDGSSPGAPTDPALNGLTGAVTNGTEYSSAINLSDPSRAKLKTMACDRSGNCSAIVSADFGVDSAALACSWGAFSPGTTFEEGEDLTGSVTCDRAGAITIKRGGTSCADATTATAAASQATTGLVSAGGTFNFGIAAGDFAEGNATVRACAENQAGSVAEIGQALTVEAPSALIFNGTTSSVAGTGGSGYNDGAAASALLNGPRGITIEGNVIFFADSGNKRIRKLDLLTNVVSTLAGSGVDGYADGAPSSAAFSGSIFGLASDGVYIFVADGGNNRIRKIEIATGVVSTLAGNGAAASIDGFGTGASIKNPYKLTYDVSSGILYVSTGGHKIRKILTGTGAVTTLSGSGTQGFLDGSSSVAAFNFPSGMKIAGSYLYVADRLNHRIRKVALATGDVSTVAGSGSAATIDGTSLGAAFNYPDGLASDPTYLYISEASIGSPVRRLHPVTGMVDTLSGGPFSLITGIAG